MRRIAIALGLAVLTANAAGLEDGIVRLVEEGKVSQAQDMARKAKATPAEMGRIQGILYHAYGMADSAVAYLEPAYKATPDDPTVSLRLAEALFWKKDLRTVRTLVEECRDRKVAAGPRPWEAMSRKARLLSWLQEFDASAAMWRKVVADKETPASWRMQASYHLAEISAWRKELDRASAMLDSLLRLDPGYVDAALLKGQILEWKGDYPQAKSTYTGALQEHPSDAQLRSRLEKLSWVK